MSATPEQNIYDLAAVRFGLPEGTDPKVVWKTAMRSIRRSLPWNERLKSYLFSTESINFRPNPDSQRITLKRPE